MKKIILNSLTLLCIVAIFTACSNADDYLSNTIKDQEVKIIYSELFSDSIKSFTAVSVTGEQKWIHDSRGYALMSGFVNPNNLANEDWLISPVIDLTNVKASHFSFDHVARYFSDPMNEATVWISENYTEGAPSGATWKQVTLMPFFDPGSWTFGTSGELSLTSYAGKKIRIAFKYISTTTKAGSWEVKNFTVLSREAVVISQNYGKGTRELPYNVFGSSINQSGKAAFVEGYIVGYIWYTNALNSFYFKSDTCTQKTNILISDTRNGFYVSRCAAVQLPAGAVRDSLNLADKKALIGRKVTLYGSLSTYFGMTGIKNVTYYKLENGSTGGREPFDPSSAIYYETFETSLGAFTTYSVSGAETWVYNGTFKCAYVSGFVSSQNRENEDWLISPQIDLTNKSNANLTFDHALRYNANPASDATVWISENYVSGAPSTATWTQLPTSFKDGVNWDFVNIGDISLSNYANKKVRIALKYVATNTKAGTWEVKNLQVYNKN